MKIICKWTRRNGKVLIRTLFCLHYAFACAIAGVFWDLLNLSLTSKFVWMWTYPVIGVRSYLALEVDLNQSLHLCEASQKWFRAKRLLLVLVNAVYTVLYSMFIFTIVCAVGRMEVLVIFRWILWAFLAYHLIVHISLMFLMGFVDWRGQRISCSPSDRPCPPTVTEHQAPTKYE